ncbi:MAG: DUF4956 domain-containing protein [Pyrinomonadaceae bacterium]
MALNLVPKNKREVFTLVVVFVGVLLLSALVVYLLAGTFRSTPDTASVAQPTPEASHPTVERRSSAADEPRSQNFVDQLFGTRQGETHLSSDWWLGNVARIALRLLLAALLGAALALRPRKRVVALKQNPYVSQTQVLLAVVAAALMIIVGDNAARAFGIFAAVSLVRFRTNIRDPKEITVLLISMALGLAAGVGRWDLAIILAVFALIVLWILESRELRLVFRTMEVKVTTHSVISTQRTLKQVFNKQGFDSELRAIAHEGSGESLGVLVYSVDLSASISTDQLTEDILSLDEQNVEGIEWSQKKNFSYLYQ